MAKDKDKHKDDKPNFENILKTPVAQVMRRRPMPQGTYLGMTVGLPRHDKSTKKQTPYLEFTIQLLEAQSDVDEEALNEALTKGNGDVTPLRERSQRHTIYTTPDSLWRLAKFYKDLGLEPESPDDEVDFEEFEAQSPGRQLYIHLKHDPSPDGETMFATIDKTAPVTE